MANWSSSGALHDTANITGLAALGAKLEKLQLDMKEKVAAAAMRKAANITLSAVQTEAPIRTGNLFHHLTIGRRTRAVPDTQVQYVLYVKTQGRKSRGGKGKRGKGTAAPSRPDPYYWFFIEFGTSKMAADPFLLRGFSKSAENAATSARDEAARLLKGVV